MYFWANTRKSMRNSIRVHRKVMIATASIPLAMTGTTTRNIAPRRELPSMSGEASQSHGVFLISEQALR